MATNIVEKHFEVEVCQYTSKEMEKVKKRLDEIDSNIVVQEISDCPRCNKPRLKVTYFEETNKDELKKSIIDTFQLSQLWQKCIALKK